MYSWVYWLAEAVVVLLGVSIVYEVLKNLVRPYSSLRVLARGVFLVGAVIAGVIGPLLLVCTASPWRTKTLIESAILMQRSLRFVHVCLLIVAGWFQSRFGLRWNRYEGGIVTGLAIAAVLDIALLELRGDLHWISHGQFVWLSPLSYNLAAVVLIAYFGPTPGRKLPPAAPPPSHLPEWNQMLREFLERRR
jgi:hypothetical protein